MTVQQDAAQVLAAHQVHGIGPGCTCGWRVSVGASSLYQHQADMLAAAGLLAVTPGEVPALAEIEAAYCETSGTDDERRRLRAEFRAWLAEHDAQVAARALRRYVGAARENPSTGAWDAHDVFHDIEDWAANIESGVLDPRADRIERQEEVSDA